MKHVNIDNIENLEISNLYRSKEEFAEHFTESEYTEKEIEAFNLIKDQWLMRRADDDTFFTADNEGGLDARARYCKYFPLVMERAVFCNGECIGVYLSYKSILYSGTCPGNYTIDDWQYPGANAFEYKSSYFYGGVHVFLFDKAETYNCYDWSLVKFEPGKTYESYVKTY